MRLGEAMVKEGLITNDVLARALERQIIFGGRLGTNLVEMGAVSEETLAKFLSKILNVPYAEPALFEDIQQDVLDAFPVKMAQKYTAFPIKKERSRLHLAMKDPNDMTVVDELQFIVGLDIRAYIASEMRILYGLEKYYGIKRDLRYVSLLDEERAQAVEPSSAKGSAPAAAAFAPPPPMPAHEEYLGDESQMEMPSEPMAYQPEATVAAPPPPPPLPAYDQTVPPPFAPQPVLAPPPPPPPPPPVIPAPVQVVVRPPEVKPVPPVPQAPAPVNPYEMLASPADREHVARAIVAAASQELARAALFLVKGSLLTGWKASGSGVTDEMVEAVKVALDAPSIFKEVVEDKVYYKGPILQVPQNTQLLLTLGGAFPLEAIAFPLVIKGKVVGVLYGDNGPGALITGNIDRLSGLMTKASLSLEILILKSKILSEI